MDTTSRRDFLILGSKMFVMTSAAAAAFEHVFAGAPWRVKRRLPREMRPALDAARAAART